MITTASEPKRIADAQMMLHAEWIAAFGSAADRLPDGDTVRRWSGRDSNFAIAGAGGSDLRLAESPAFVAAFSGVLTNVAELQPGSTQKNAAQIVLNLVASLGLEAFNTLRGPFAVLVWDRTTGTLLAARDHVGLEPLFYARCGTQGWLLSPSPDRLVAEPGVSSDPDAVAMSEWLCGWFPAVEDTAYRDVKRIPPATAIAFGDKGLTQTRYWDAFGESETVQTISEDELDQFEPLLTRAVNRTTQGRPSAVFLSGGLDSICVALTASDLARDAQTPAPLALSLVFPDRASNEETVQKGVATRLGLEQVLVPFNDAVGPKGLLAEALALSATWPQPMWNIWSPAYLALGRHGAAANCRTILTGRGGDEWLTISPYLLADQLRRGDLAGAWRLLQMRRRSNNLGSRAAARLVWLAGCRPLISALFDAAAPRLWHQERRRRLLAARPAWVAPDPGIQRAMHERLDRWIDPARPRRGFYHREGATAVRHPAVAHDLEETQELGRRLGPRVLHPFWDIDLLVMLHRVPPELLMKDGRSKWLVRRRLGARLPNLGLENRGKVSAAHVFRTLMNRDVDQEWKRLRGAVRLGELGVVRGADIESRTHGLIGGVGGSGRLWTLLNLENWVQARV